MGYEKPKKLDDFWGTVRPKNHPALLIEGIIFSEERRTAPFLRKNYPWILQPQSSNYVSRGSVS
jgi:hypothetical protein